MPVTVRIPSSKVRRAGGKKWIREHREILDFMEGTREVELVRTRVTAAKMGVGGRGQTVSL